MRKKIFLIAKTEGDGRTALRRMRARSKAEITERIPGGKILDPHPTWMTQEHLDRLNMSSVLDIDEPLDIHMMTQSPGLVYSQNDPPSRGQIIRDPDGLAKARKMFRERAENA